MPYQCLGTHIPPFVEVDVKGLDVDGLVRVRDLPIPEGTRLIKQVSGITYARSITQTEADMCVLRIAYYALRITQTDNAGMCPCQYHSAAQPVVLWHALGDV